jgi:hypothetical protein
MVELLSAAVRVERTELLMNGDWRDALSVPLRNGSASHSAVIALCLWWEGV